MPDFLITRETAVQHKRKSLDAIEGEGTNYARHPITVKPIKREPLAAITYRVINPTSGLRTNVEYVGYIVSGLREHDVAEEYIDKVKAIAIVNNPTIAAEVKAL